MNLVCIAESALLEVAFAQRDDERSHVAHLIVR